MVAIRYSARTYAAQLTPSGKIVVRAGGRVAIKATCACGLPAAAAVILDMFGGSGTVGQVGLELGRLVILIEISAEYMPLIQRRCEVMSPLEL